MCNVLFISYIITKLKIFRKIFYCFYILWQIINFSKRKVSSFFYQLCNIKVSWNKMVHFESRGFKPQNLLLYDPFLRNHKSLNIQSLHLFMNIRETTCMIFLKSEIPCCFALLNSKCGHAIQVSRFNLIPMDCFI